MKFEAPLLSRSLRRAFARLVAAITLTLVGGAAAAQDGPKLVVLLMVDQFRADYVDSYGHQWQHGLRRMLDEGAWFPDAAYPYLKTVTCPGHATVATGAYPRTHGIVGNSWWDREAGAMVRCTVDPSAGLVSYGEALNADAPGESAHRLLVPTLADRMRADLAPAPRVVTMSSKQRSAIMLAGHHADAVTWLEGDKVWVTSTAYADAPVPFVTEYVQAHPIEAWRGAGWERTLPADQYLHADDVAEERPPGSGSRTFPHAFSAANVDPAEDRWFWTRWKYSPNSDDYLAGLALAAVDSLELGQQGGVDYLGIGFSTLDFVGHQFGPRSHEVQDVLIRLDATIGRLLATLDDRVGAGRYVVGLSADHGVSPIPERLVAEGVDAGRIRMRPTAETIESLLVERLGPGPHVARATGTEIYLTDTARSRLTYDTELRQAVIDLMLETPGISDVFLAWLPHDDANLLQRAAALTRYESRSGDLVGIAAPNWIQGAAASHGTANDYDQRVPVALFGFGIAPGTYPGAASPADIAPTLAELLGLTMPQADGRALREAIRPDASPGRSLDVRDLDGPGVVAPIEAARADRRR